MDKNRTNPLDNIIDFREFLYKILNNWYYFLLSILFALLIAFGFNRYSQELYRVSTKIQINKDDSNTSTTDVLYNTLNNNDISLKDEVSLITSFPIVFKTVSDLRFDIGYFLKGNVKTSESLFAPIEVICDKEFTQNKTNFSFDVEIIDDNTYNLYCKKLDFNGVFSFGEKVKLESYNFTIQRKFQDRWDDYPVTIVKFRNLKQIAKQYQSKIKVEDIEKESNIISLYLYEEDQNKGVVFLNSLVDNFIKSQIDFKKKSSSNTVEFIKNEIKNIEDSLSLIEIKLQNYKNTRQIPDINLKTQNIYKKISLLEDELASYKYQDKYYSYLEDYINSDNNFENTIAPSTYGITNTSLSEMVKKLVNIQLEKNVLINGGQINNPSIDDFDLQLNQLTININEIIKNSRKSNNNIINDLNKRISVEELSLESLPIEQRELLNIERIQKTSESLYMFLLQKKSEAEITASSISSNIKHLEPAIFFNKNPIYPNNTQTYTIAILLGLLLPILILIIVDFFDDKIKSRIDLERLTKIKLIGLIGRNHTAHNLLTKLNPKSAISEGFRTLRSNLEYIDKDSKQKLYLVTSSISGEGKTFVASNLAVVFANSGKKTLLLGADLRRPKIYEDFNNDNKKGLSTILSGENSFKDVVINTEDNNLDVIISGPTPFNPSDMLLNKNFEDLISLLKKKYDKIIIDTAPVGLVADAYMVMKFTDVNLYIVRQNYTSKETLRFVNGLNEDNRIHNLHLVLNDVSSGSGVYGYGKYSYGYGYGYNYGSYINNSEYFDED